MFCFEGRRKCTFKAKAKVKKKKLFSQKCGQVPKSYKNWTERGDNKVETTEQRFLIYQALSGVALFNK